MVAVEQTQSNLLKLNSQLSEKTHLINNAKTELDKALKGLQERNKWAFQLQQTEDFFIFISFNYHFLFLVLVLRVLMKLQKQTISTEAALEHLRLTKHNLLLACKIDSLPLVLISGALDDISEIQVQTEGHVCFK